MFVFYSHAFQGPTGKWYIENLCQLLESPTLVAVEQRCWNSGVESDKDNARSRKHKTDYYANVLIIKDPAHIQNWKEGHDL